MAKRNKSAALNQLVVERLMHYYHLVAEQIEAHAGGHVSSAQIADLMDMDDTLVRKDLAAIGVRGRPRVGFSTSELMGAIRDTLGFNERYKSIIVGAGRLGGAIASYGGFGKYGLDIVALFDADPARQGEALGGATVQPIDTVESVVREQGVHLAVLTVPADAAQPL
ncbi:MAG: redox-sensing transcriptional repressor Rex, partial [Candidatus Hydrogenedentes bacterium]|nr:redox-sensing transcriptional repressor Rex [Candidatus Hydrogenedentota bacterium]